MRLIDADAVYNKAEENHQKGEIEDWEADSIIDYLDGAPTINDAEIVVRCASCKYVRPTVNAHTGEQVGIWCCLHDILNVSPDDYCSRSEKKGATE